MNEGNSNTGSAADELSAELLQFCESNSLSEEGLRKIIEKYELTPDHNLHGDNNFSHAFFLDACNNERVTEDIIRLLIEYFPHAPRVVGYYERTPLHVACENKSASLKMIQLLIEAAPDSIRHADVKEELPIHRLCSVADGNVKVQMKVLKMLLDKYPVSIRRTNHRGDLPLHCAAYRRSPEIFQLLVESYPGAILVGNYYEKLPLHIACTHNTLPTVEYLYNLYPDAINHATSSGDYPIHYAIMNGIGRRRAALDIVRFLLNSDTRVKLQKLEGEPLLHVACMQNYDDSYENVGDCVQMIEAIYDAHPESIRCTDEMGNLPIHLLCNCNDENVKKDEKVAVTILKLLLDKYPESSRHTNNTDNLPLHYACRKKSPEFCQLLIESYPDSVRVSGGCGGLPLHFATHGNTLATVEYLYKMYPDAVNHATPEGFYPIHWAMSVAMMRNNPKSVGIIKLLLDCDHRVKLQKYQSKSLLCVACGLDYTDAEVETGIQAIKAIYDAYPEAIQEDDITSSIHLQHEQVQAFVNGEMIYARQAGDRRLMMTPDENGQFPLHRALKNNVRLGSIKLLVNGNLSAARSADNNGSLPLHLACQYHKSPRVIEHLIDLYPTTLQRVDFDQSTALHDACRGANYRAISLLLDKYDATSVSMRNVHNELPIDLLFKSNAVEDREGVEYTDCVFRLLRAFPETMTMNRGMQMGRTSLVTSSSPRHVGKKRKFSNGE